MWFNNRKSSFLCQSPNRISVADNDSTLIFKLLHQIISFSHSVAVNWQVTKRCSRDSSVTPQKEQAEESVFPIFFKNVFVARFKRVPILRLLSLLSLWINSLHIRNQGQHLDCSLVILILLLLGKVTQMVMNLVNFLSIASWRRGRSPRYYRGLRQLLVGEGRVWLEWDQAPHWLHIQSKYQLVARLQCFRLVWITLEQHTWATLVVLITAAVNKNNDEVKSDQFVCNGLNKLCFYPASIDWRFNDSLSFRPSIDLDKLSL